MKSLVLFCFFLCPTFAHGLIGGVAAKAHEFPSVLIWTISDIDLSQSYCTGTKISQDAFLTAAHCVMGQSPTYPTETYKGIWTLSKISSVKISFDRELKKGYDWKSYDVIAIGLPKSVRDCREHVNPKKCEHRVPQPDLAIIRIDAHKQSTFGQAPQSIPSFHRVVTGQTIMVNGYGIERNVRAPRLKYSHLKVASLRTFKNSAQYTFASIDGFFPMHRFFTALSQPDAHDHANLGFGDSGGAVFDERGRIIGVNSDGYCPIGPRDCRVTNNSIFSRISRKSYSEMIGQTPQNQRRDDD